MKKVLFILLALVLSFNVNAQEATCPDDKPMEDKYGNCHTCEEDAYGITKKGCERCSNRYFSSSLFDECLFKSCPTTKPIKTENGDCHSCDDLLSIEDVVEEECAKCPNRKLKGGRCILSECPSENPMRGDRGGCFSCEAEFFLEKISADECAKCPNMKMIDGKCSEATCPQDKPARGLDGICRSCDFLNSFVKISAEECAKCPNKQLVDGHCIAKECPLDYPVRDLDGECHSCGYFSMINSTDLSEQECMKCSDRIFKNNHCILKECPSDSPIRNEDGKCYSCQHEFFISNISPDECAKCSNRKMENGRCIQMKECPPEKPLFSSTGTCFSCDFGLSTNFSKEDCAKCPNREMVEDKCIFKVCPDGLIKDDDTGMCLKERTLFIDETIQAGNEPKWDYLEKDIECDYKNICTDKNKKRINGVVKQEMFDFYTTIPYVNGEAKGIVKFYTQQNEFVADMEISTEKEFEPSLGNQNFAIMMEKVARDKHKVLSLVVYLNSCFAAYQKGKITQQSTCKELLKNEKEPGLMKDKTIAVKQVALKNNKNGDVEDFIEMKLPDFPEKYLSEFKRKMFSPSIKVEKDGNDLIVYYDYY